jgi:hypothetical protein
VQTTSVRPFEQGASCGGTPQSGPPSTAPAPPDPVVPATPVVPPSPLRGPDAPPFDPPTGPGINGSTEHATAPASSTDARASHGFGFNRSRVGDVIVPAIEH